MSDSMNEGLSSQSAELRPRGEIMVFHDPTAILEKAQKAASALMQVVNQRKDKLVINGETYLEIEDWQLLGKFCGNVSTRTVETRFVDYGGIHGFEAVAEVYDPYTGAIFSRAEMVCMNDEEKWRSKPRYEYHYVLADGTLSKEDPGSENIVWTENKFKPGKMMPKKEKVYAGEDPVPMVQLKSMSQTRAQSKALRQYLGYIVRLAGIKATPAEEMDGVGGDREKDQGPPAAAPPTSNGNGERSAPPQSAPQNQARRPPSMPQRSSQRAEDYRNMPISEGREKRFWAIARSKKLNDDHIKDFLMTNYGIESTSEILTKDYEDVVKWAESGGSSKAQPSARFAEEPPFPDYEGGREPGENV